MDSGSAKELDRIRNVSQFWRFCNNIEFALSRLGGAYARWDSVAFAQLPNDVADGTLYLFKTGVSARIDEPANRAGGKWVSIASETCVNSETLNGLFATCVVHVIDSADRCWPRQKRVAGACADALR